MKTPEFVHLHNHSSYSLLDGLSTPSSLAKEASRLGFKYLALTDHGTGGGLFNFQKSCREHDIVPIIGSELYICDDHTVKNKDMKRFHLLVLAKNAAGYDNLVRLITKSNDDGFYMKPRIDFNMLCQHHEGLIVTSACPIGEIPYLLNNGMESKAESVASKFKDVFGDDFYIEIMSHDYINNNPQQEIEKQTALKLYRMASRMGIKAICTNDTHYASRGDCEAHDALLSIQTKNCIKNENRFSFHSNDFYLKSAIEMANRYSKAPELLKHTMEIAEKIDKNDLILSGQDLLPDPNRPPEFSSNEDWLKSLVTDGMKEKGLINKIEYRERIKHEMGVILNCGYIKYFLILFQLMNFAKQQGIRVGIGRGSAASSLVLYILDVVKIDPIEYGLIFERFLNPDRISPPDVDLDFDFYRRDEIHNYFNEKYGIENCCHIGTYNTMKAKAVVRNASKALDIGGDWEDYERLKKSSPNLKAPKTFKKSLDIGDFISKTIPDGDVKIEDVYKDEQLFRQQMIKYPKLYEIATKIEGTYSYGGKHASGLIVCRDKIKDHIALRRQGDVRVSEFDGPDVVYLGLLKFDILGLKTLSVVEKTLQLIKKRHNIDIDIDNLEPNDKEVFKLFNGGYSNMDTRGIFQFESKFMDGILKNINVDRFEDLIVANALGRPGPAKAGVIDMYCDFKHGRKAIKYLHPKMGEALDQTYGLMVYQESVMKVSQILAGFTGAQADTLRKAMGKKKPEIMAKQRKMFVDGCVKNGVASEVANKVFEQIDFFSGYGFNKSHSAAYAFLAYQTAYLKVYYPIEFMCSLLSSEIDNSDKNLKLNSYLKEAKRMNIPTIRTHINKSSDEFVIESGKNKKQEVYEYLRAPFSILKGVGDKAVKDITKNQPFESLEDFMRRSDSQVINKTVLEALINSHCMTEAFLVEPPELLKQYPAIKKDMEKEKRSLKKEAEEMSKYEGSVFDDFDFDGESLEI